jgi:hypothetical protein
MAKYMDYMNQSDNRIVYDKSPTQGMPVGAANYQPPISREYTQGGDLRSINLPMSQIESMKESSIQNVPNMQFKIGKMAIENEFIHDTNLAKQTVTDTVQLDVIYQNAKMVHDMKMQELANKFQKNKLLIDKYSKDPTLTSQDRFIATQELMEKDPIWRVESPQIDYTEKQIFTPAQIQKGLGEISQFIDLENKEMAIQSAIENFGPNYKEVVPQVDLFIEQNFQEEPVTSQQKEKRNFFRTVIDSYTAPSRAIYRKYKQSKQQEPTKQQTKESNSIYAVNKKTGQRIMSNDGGKTWQMAQ